MKQTTFLFLLMSLFSIEVGAQLDKNTIYFSTKKVDPLNVETHETQTSFSSTDDIYAFFISDQTMEEFLAYDQNYYWLDTKELPALSKMRFNTLEDNVNPMVKYFVFPVLLHNDEHEYRRKDAFEVMQHLASLSAGEHTIQLSLKRDGVKILTGNFSLVVDEKDDEISTAKEINPTARDGKGYLKYGMKQSDIEDEILLLFQESYPSQGFKKTIITSTKYIYKRDSNGDVEARLLEADILNEQGGKCRAYDVTIKQQKIGSNYGVIEQASINGFYPISCDDM